MKLTKQDLLRLPKERLAEIIVEMQEKETTPIPIPSITPPTPSCRYCVFAPNGQCDQNGNCWLCPHKQITVTTFKAEDIQNVDAKVGETKDAKYAYTNTKH